MNQRPQLITLQEMKPFLTEPALTTEIERAFIAYSAGDAVVPAVGELIFDAPPGDVHIKYGYIKKTPHFVVKIASSFYANPAHGLPSSDGVMLVFGAETGALQAILLDEGYLTNVRTAIAGALAARSLMPRQMRKIGVIGSGTQARLQVEYLQSVTTCRDVMLWGRSPNQAMDYARDMFAKGFSVTIAESPSKLVQACDLVVTTTPSTTPFIFETDLHPGLHITAVGADSPGKQEIAASAIGLCDVVVCDSRSQCSERGDIAHAMRANLIKLADTQELGDVLAGRAPGRTSDGQITLADLTGVAVQDMAIASFVLRRINSRA